jgi:uncharacterized membrane protein YbhN (UPF0104 family)
VSKLKRYSSWILMTAGLVIIAYYVHRVGVGNLISAFERLGWGIVLLLALPLFLYFVHAVGWSYTMSAENRRKIGLFRLTVLQSISYGVAGMVPLQGIVSEPLKLMFLRGRDYDKEDFAASLLVDNFINGIAIAVIILGGLIYLAAVLATDLWIKLVTVGFVLLMAALIAFAIFLQKRGLFSSVLRLLGRLPPLAAWAESARDGAERIDDHVRAFYSGNRKSFFLSLFWHVVEKAHGVAEFWVIFYFLGFDVSWGACFFIFAVVSTLDNLLFFAQVGGMEAWVSTLLGMMKLTRDNINITAALFRRVRFLFWAMIALAIVYPTRRLFAQSASAGDR